MISKLVERFNKLNSHDTNIAVVGDIILDRYLYGKVTRISPEAPVPIVSICDSKNVLGGASNVAANLAGIKSNVFISGVIGNDDNGNKLLDLLKNFEIDNRAVILSDLRKTITKIRIIGAQQQMLRMDFEDVNSLNNNDTVSLYKNINNLVKSGLDGIIISDYAKGVCSEEFCKWIIKLAHDNGICVLIDPKGYNWDKYRGCDFITPNLKELCDVSGYKCHNIDDDIVTMAKNVKDKYDIKNVVVTRSEKGITLVNDTEVLHSSALAREVFDVSGAGDTVAAVFLYSVLNGFTYKEAMDLANFAAGIVVRKVGTYPIKRDDLQEYLNSRIM